MTRRSEGNCRANTAGFKDGGRSVMQHPVDHASAEGTTTSFREHGIDHLLTQAQQELRKPHTLFGYVYWAARVAGYKKILGLPAEPFQAYLGDRVFDFSKVQFKPDGVIELRLRKMTRKEKAELKGKVTPVPEAESL